MYDDDGEVSFFFGLDVLGSYACYVRYVTYVCYVFIVRMYCITYDGDSSLARLVHSNSPYLPHHFPCFPSRTVVINLYLSLGDFYVTALLTTMKTSLEAYRLLDGDSQDEYETHFLTKRRGSCQNQSRSIVALSIILAISLAFNAFIGARYIQKCNVKIQHIPEKSPFGMQDPKRQSHRIVLIVFIFFFSGAYI